MILARIAIVTAVFAPASVALTQPAEATFHLMQIEQVLAARGKSRSSRLR